MSPRHLPSSRRSIASSPPSLSTLTISSLLGSDRNRDNSPVVPLHLPRWSPPLSSAAQGGEVGGATQMLKDVYGFL
ncbi:hypothetical protein GUJ93_ZPchr0002g23188 [Zizania palustris]|uniref:Uncharacterized protein n=1 Tax=Zizania palustris TaxID=103762 RepID=A0A8J5S453_ZIZPA|nr:hypothetical protein GUJ93_ZPchr0002g23188 [Zizania palustris]